MRRLGPPIGSLILVELALHLGATSARAAERPRTYPAYVQPCDCTERFNYGFGDGQHFGSGYGWGVGHGFGTGYGFGVGFGFNGGSAGGYSAGYRHRWQHYSEYHDVR